MNICFSRESIIFLYNKLNKFYVLFKQEKTSSTPTSPTKQLEAKHRPRITSPNPSSPKINPGVRRLRILTKPNLNHEADCLRPHNQSPKKRPKPRGQTIRLRSVNNYGKCVKR